MDYLRFSFLSFGVSAIITVFLSTIFNSNFSSTLCFFLFLVFFIAQVIKNLKMKKMSGNEKNSIAEDNGASAFISVFIMPLFCFILLVIVFHQLLPKDYIHGFIYLFCLILLFIFISIFIALVNALLVSKKKEKLKDKKASDAL